MLFVDPFFLFGLLPAALAAFYLAHSRWGVTGALGVVTLASAVFYAPYGLRNAIILIISVVVNFAIGAELAGSSARGESARKWLLAIGLVADFVNLATFKYLDQVAALVAPSYGPVLGFAIPVGVSFYTFHQAVFLFDAYNRQPEVVAFVADARTLAGKARTLIRYAAFVAFFPQLIIGPIVYMSEFEPQIAAPGFGRVRAVNFQVGATLMIVGLFKKLIIADSIAPVIDPLYAAASHGAVIDPSHARLAVLGYFFQLYFDFSGYSDVSLGIARLFGLRLPINFDSPLRATGIVDFYRRWHMTLTRVIVLFVFTPLSLWGARAAIARGWKGWRQRALRAWIPLLATFEVIALWHAAKTTFILFGLIHGAWYVIETEARASRAFKGYRARTSDGFRRFAGMAATALPLMLTFALFRSETLAGFRAIVVPFFGLWPTVSVSADIERAMAPVVKDPAWWRLAAVAVVVYLAPNVYEMLDRYRPCLRTFDNASNALALMRLRWRPTLAWAAIVSAIAMVVLAHLNVPTPFLYAGF